MSRDVEQEDGRLHNVDCGVSTYMQERTPDEGAKEFTRKFCANTISQEAFLSRATWCIATAVSHKTMKSSAVGTAVKASHVTTPKICDIQSGIRRNLGKMPHTALMPQSIKLANRVAQRLEVKDGERGHVAKGTRSGIDETHWIVIKHHCLSFFNSFATALPNNSSVCRASTMIWRSFPWRPPRL